MDSNNMRYFTISQVGEFSLPAEIDIDPSVVINKGTSIYYMIEGHDTETGDIYEHEAQLFNSEYEAWDRIFKDIDDRIEHIKKIRHELAARAASKGYMAKNTRYTVESGHEPSPHFKFN